MSSDEQLNLFQSFGVPASQSAAVAVDTEFGFDEIPTNAAVPIHPETYQNLEQLAAHCAVCQRCGLGKTRLNAVVGRGAIQAPIMIIGEGPGQNEDEQGLPFVGRSGQLLEKILAAVNFSTEQEVYICNVVRCRPPDNRVPTPEEIAACKPYLLEQIRLVNPLVILLTGATALKAVTGSKTSITKVRGEWIEWEGRLCMPIFHPAYLLRNSSKEEGAPKWLMWQDMKKVRAKIQELQGARGEPIVSSAD
jgi:uracil-DNA glycosylase